MSLRSLLCLLVLLGALPPVWPAEPPYRRRLQGDDLAQAAALAKQARDAEAADDCAAALRAAEQVLALRRRVQGPDHWETINTRWEVESLRRLAAVTPQLRAERRAAEQGGIEALRLEDQGRFAQALPLKQKLLD